MNQNITLYLIAPAIGGLLVVAFNRLLTTFNVLVILSGFLTGFFIVVLSNVMASMLTRKEANSVSSKEEKQKKEAKK